MSTKQDVAVELFAKGYNCAQAVLAALCRDKMERELAFRLANGFGGGARCGEVCGAVSGALMAVGLECGFYVEGDLKQKGYCNAKSFELIQKFVAENGSMLCRELLGVDVRVPDDHNKPGVPELHKTICPKVIVSAVGVFEGMAF